MSRRFPRVRKAERLKFIKLVEAGLRERGAEQCSVGVSSSYNGWSLKTPFGYLWLGLCNVDYSEIGIGQVFGRFDGIRERVPDDAERKKLTDYLGCNPFTYKWNHGYYPSSCPGAVEAAESFLAQLDWLLSADSPDVPYPEFRRATK